MNVIEEIFKKSETGTLTYEQFKNFADGMKFADISKGDYVSKSKFDNEISSRDEQIKQLNTTIATRDTDLADLQKKLEEAGNDATKLAELNTSFSDLQTKYDNDIKQYQAQLENQRYEFAVNTLANTKKFTSGAAKRDFIHSLMDSKLKMEGENIVGIDDFITKYSADNADAFVKEPENPTPNDNKLPQFAGSTQAKSDNSEGAKTNPFGWNFQGVR
jgi:hypothetical protein